MAEPNFQNRTLYHGDNLDFLRGMNSESAHLIATDPPFNKGRDFHATPDSLAKGARFQDRWKWDKDVHPDWVDQIKDDWPNAWSVIELSRKAHGDDMGAFLCFMGVRLMEMRRTLRDDGSIYIHLDDTAYAYVKVLMDAIFGRMNFRAQLVWRRYGSHNDAKGYGRVYDVILFYTKSGEYTWNGVYEDLDPDYVSKAYRHKDERGRYRTAPLHTGGLSGNGYEYEFRGHKRIWRYPRERMRQLEADGRIRQARQGKGVPERKVYLSESKGRPISNLWVGDSVKPLTGNNKERTDYPTQKPLALYERIIRASSNPGDFVIDPFCGCATTPIAAERLGRQWVGMDIWDDARDVVMDRMRKENLAAPDAKAQPPPAHSFLQMSIIPLRRPSARTATKRPPPDSRSKFSDPRSRGRRYRAKAYSTHWRGRKARLQAAARASYAPAAGACWKKSLWRLTTSRPNQSAAQTIS